LMLIAGKPTSHAEVGPNSVTTIIHVKTLI
jgi:hypothetical protein